MAQTFDIRFARSAGLAAMLEAPSNSFHWTGSGSLSIDAQGISVAVKRGLSSLLTVDRTRRIPAAALKEVFREGEALRVEFATSETARASLRFWAIDRDTAAHIVRLLPTSRTVELEESAARGDYRVNRRIAIGLGVVLAVIAGVIIAISTSSQRPADSTYLTTSEQAPPVVPAALPAVPTTTETPAAQALQPAIEPASTAPVGIVDTGRAGATPTAALTTEAPTGATEPNLPAVEPDTASPNTALTRDARAIVPPPLVPPGPAVTDPNVTPIPHGTLSFSRALRQLALFGSESDDLLAGYDDDFNRFSTGQIGVVEFTKRLSNLEERWLGVTARIEEAQDFADPLLVDLRATLLACARERRSFLTSFSQGTSTRDQQAIKSALEHQALAVELDQRARRYID